MTQSNINEAKQNTLDKWGSLGIIDPSKQKWMEQYANQHKLMEDEMTNSLGIPSHMMGNSQSQSHSTSIFGSQSHPSLLTLAIQVAAKTIGQDLVAVKPLEMPTGYESDEDKAERLGKIRDGKIDAVLKEEEWELPDDLKEPKLKSQLMYLDFEYGASSSNSNSTSKYQKNFKQYKKK